MTDDVPDFYLHKQKKSLDYYLGFQSALRWNEDESKRWLDETFGEAPSTEKRAAYLAFQHIAANARIPMEATIAAYDAAKAAGKVHEVDY